MWENPFYFFRILTTSHIGELERREIIIDVTLSALNRYIRAKDLKDTLNILLGSNSEYDIENVLDFGCGKFLTVKNILNKHKKVTVVDFKELLNKYDYLNTELEKFKQDDLFTKMEFPQPFISDNTKYDLCLLINSLPVMPVFLERLLVLQILHNKILDSRYLLWFASVDQSRYKRRSKFSSTSLGDGIWIDHKRGNHKTFYKYHSIDYVILILQLSGFQLEEYITEKLEVKCNDVLLFRKCKYNLLQDNLTIEYVSNIMKCQMNIVKGELVPVYNNLDEINPYPIEYDLLSLVKKILSEIRLGNEDLDKYIFFISVIFQYLFFNAILTIKSLGADKISNINPINARVKRMNLKKLHKKLNEINSLVESDILVYC